MTVVLTVNTVFAGAVVIADSRLTGYSKRGDPYPYRDVCQKLLLANGWSIVGFAGLLCQRVTSWAASCNGSAVTRTRSVPVVRAAGWAPVFRSVSRSGYLMAMS